VFLLCVCVCVCVTCVCVCVTCVCVCVCVTPVCVTPSWVGPPVEKLSGLLEQVFTSHLMHGSLDPRESTSEVAFLSVQPLLRAHGCDQQTDHTVMCVYQWCQISQLVLWHSR